MTQSRSDTPAGGIFREPEFWFILAVGLCFWYRPLFCGDTFFFRDLYLHFFPQKRHVAELLLKGELPLWDPYLHGGQPLLGNMNNAALYPTVILYLLLPPVTAFNLDIILHLMGASAAAYALARVLGLKPSGAMATGAVYGYCGLQLSLPNVWLYAGTHLPLMLLFWHLLWIRKRGPWLALLVITGGLQVLAGRPEWPLFTLLLLLGWTLLYPYENTGPLRKWIVWILACVLIVGISLIQILPMLEVIRQSSGSRSTDLAAFTAWSIHPFRLPELVFPGFMGHTNSALARNYWGGRYESLGFPYMLSIYFGIMTLLLAAFAGFSRSAPDTGLPLRIRRFFLLLSAMAFLLSLGKYLPGFESLHTVPLLGSFRYPTKFAMVAMLPVSLLAGQALSLNLFSRRCLLTLFLVTILVTAFTLVFFFRDRTALAFTRFYFQTESETVRKALSASFLHTTGVLLACCTIGVLVRKYAPNGRGTTAIAVVLLLDLCLAGRTVNPLAPGWFLRNAPGLSQWLLNNIGDERLYRAPTPGDVNVIPAGKERFLVDVWHLETLDSYMAALYSIPVIFHEDLDRLGPMRSVRLGQQLHLENEREAAQILSAASVRYIITAKPPQSESMRIVRKIPNHSNHEFFLIRNEASAPRVSFITRWMAADSPDRAIELITRPGFNPRSEVVLEQTGQPDRSTGINPSRVVTLNSNASSASLEVESATNGYLVFADTFYPGWQYRVDDQIVQPIHANYAFTAIQMPAGRHLVLKAYRPASFRDGTLATLGFLVLLIFTAFQVPRAIAHPRKQRHNDQHVMA